MPASTARTVAPAGPRFSSSPSRYRIKGARKTCATTSADTGCPGSPNTGLPPTDAISVGFPGLIAMPCACTTAPGSDATTLTMWSRSPTELPPESATTSAEASAFSSAALSRAGSSGTLSNCSVSPPELLTSAAIECALMSRIRPGGGTAAIGTISSPVEMTAARGLRYTATSVMPSPARRPISWGRSRFPAGITTSPRATSSAVPRTFSPAVTGLVTSIAPSPAGEVYSTITTASAPFGRNPPVGIATAWFLPMATSGSRPIATAPATSRNAGMESEAPKVSAARTAKPSIVERGRGGRSSGEAISAPQILPRASSSGTVSTARRLKPASASNTCSGVTTLKNSGTAIPHHRTSITLLSIETAEVISRSTRLL